MDTKGIADGYPRLINEWMPELPNNIDASLHLPALHATSCQHSDQRSRNCPVIEEDRTYMFKVKTILVCVSCPITNAWRSYM